METLRYEVSPFGLQVAMVEPGAIKTPFYATPPADGMAVYSPWSRPFFDTMKGFENKAPGPDVVAAVYSRIVRSNNPPLRNTVTTEAKLFPFLRWLLPHGFFETGMRVGFKINDVRA